MKFPSILLAAVLVATPQLAAADTASVNIALITWADEWIGPALSEPMRVAAQQGGHSPLAMFMGADIVVKAVMFGLAIASVLGWAVWAGKILQVSWANARLRRSYRKLAKAGAVKGAQAKSFSGPMRAMIRAALAEAGASSAPPRWCGLLAISPIGRPSIRISPATSPGACAAPSSRKLPVSTSAAITSRMS